MSEITDNESNLDQRITQIHVRMAALQPDTKEYAAAADQLVKLQALKKEKHSWRPSPDVLVNAAASTLGILLIVAYEQRHAWVSKATGFVPKLFK